MDLPKQVYAIQHNVTKKIYVGSSKDPATRYQSHMTALRTSKHTNEDMQADFNKYGEDYSFFILDEINTFQERTKEYDWMEKYNTFDRNIGYNYKDQARERKFRRNFPPYKEGAPEPLKTTLSVRDIEHQDLTTIKKTLQSHIKAFADLCGEDDEISTLPATEALEALEKVLEYFKDIAYLETAV